MKEHSIFLEAAFAIKDRNLIAEADAFKNEFTRLLSHAISLSDGLISPTVLSANEIVTKYTLDAEKATQFVTGIYIDSNLTVLETSIRPHTPDTNLSMLADQIYMLNNRSISATNKLINFKNNLLNNVLSCKVFTAAYPLLINHIKREAILFASSLTRLQKGLEINIDKYAIEQETFWNDIMSEHSFFIRGLLDPTETELFDIANNFGKEFETLRKEASAMNKSPSDFYGLTDKTLNETIKLRDFKAQGTEGLIACKIRSIMVPLLGDHVLREANHYINLLKSFHNV